MKRNEIKVSLLVGYPYADCLSSSVCGLSSARRWWLVHYVWSRIPSVGGPSFVGGLVVPFLRDREEEERPPTGERAGRERREVTHWEKGDHPSRRDRKRKNGDHPQGKEGRWSKPNTVPSGLWVVLVSSLLAFLPPRPFWVVSPSLFPFHRSCVGGTLPSLSGIPLLRRASLCSPFSVGGPCQCNWMKLNHMVSFFCIFCQ